MNWLQWCIVLIITLSSTNCLQCPNTTGCINCNLKNNMYELDCISGPDSSFTFALSPAANNIHITCYNSTSWLDFNFQTIDSIELTQKLSFDSCDLPKLSSFSEFINKLNLINLDNLEFRSHDGYLNLNRTIFKNLKSIKRLNFFDNTKVNLTSDSFYDLVNLKTIYLVNNGIKKLPINLFTMPNLEAIELGMNNIEIIKPGVFGKQQNIKFLNLWSNDIKIIQQHAFDTLKSLEILGLQNNNLELLNENIFIELINLEIINLSENKFNELPQKLFINNKKLKNFQLSGNKINIKTLTSKLFDNLTSLINIELNRNGFTWLPEDLLTGTIGLESLSIMNNQLKKLPEKIFKDCVNLKTLDLMSNELIELPNGVFLKQHKLEVLNLKKNKIQTIEDGVFDGLVQLKILNIQNNNLKIINPNCFDGLGKLEIANLSNNYLSFDDYILSPFKLNYQLKELHLANNNINKMFPDWFIALKLEHLDLSYNKFDIITNNDFQFMSNGLKINLEYNNISQVLFPDGIQYMENTEYLDDSQTSVIVSIDNNPIICDCNIYNLLCYIEKVEYQIQFQFDIKNLACNGPNHLKNINIKSLNSTTLKCLSNEANNDDKYCPEICECWLEPYSHKFIIDCSYKNLTTSPLINPPSDYYLEINLTGNYLKQIPCEDGYKNATVLILSHNKITDISLSSLSRRIKVLKLDNNMIQSIDLNTLEYFEVAMNLSEITIYNNPWKCDCDGIYLLKFLEKMKDKIPKMMKVTCDVNNLSVLTMTSDELCPSYAYIYVVLSLCIVILVIIYTILCKYMRDVKIWLYSRNMCLNFITENDIDQEKLYDAFISYSHKDSNFVLDELIPKLENGPVPFKLCVHYRDWKAGVSITQQIVESINSSRRTIIILSANFLESIWGIVEFRTAYQLSEKENKSRIIMIVYGDIPDVDKLDDNDLKHYMKKTTYLEWKDQRFWKKLMYALPHSSHLKKQIDIQ